MLPALRLAAIGIGAIGAILAFHPGNAQGLVSGRVLDKASQPLTGVTVLLLRTGDSSLLKGLVTDQKGAFAFAKVKPGSYILSYSAAGHERSYLPFELQREDEDKDLGTQILSEASGVMDAVTVRATVTKPLFEQKIDRMVVNVAGNITAAGSSVLDILERSPGVVVDRQNGNIAIAGKSGVVVMINGKINHMPLSGVLQMLAGMPAGNIEKIELITAPPANLDAEGNAGYINIVLKTNDEYGTHGYVSASFGYGNRDMPEASIDLNHRQGKINLYGDYSFSRLHQEQDWDFYHQVSNSGQINEIETLTDRNTVQRNHTIRLGMDYQPGNKTVIGTLFTAYNNKWSMDAHSHSTQKTNGAVDTSLEIASTEINQWTHYGGNLNFQHLFAPGQTITYNLDYFQYNANNPIGYLTQYYDANEHFLFLEQTRTTKLTPIHFWVNAIDYTQRLGKKASLETGLKSTISRFPNNVGFDRLQNNAWVEDPAFSAKYQLKEDIEAAYAIVNINPDDRTEIKAGLRYEYTNSNLGSDSLANIVDRHYGKLFPSFSISHKFGADKKLGLAYFRRISRPSFRDLAPFTIFVDPTTYFTGNPALQPSLSDAVKMDVSYRAYTLSVTYTYEQSPIGPYTPSTDSATDIAILSSSNLANSQVLSAVFVLPLDILPWWKLAFSATGVWAKTNAFYNGKPVQLEQKSINLNLNQTFHLPNNFTAEVVGFYQSAQLFGAFRQAALGSLDVGVSKKLGLGTLRLNFTNILNTMQWKWNIDQPEYNLVWRSVICFNYPAVKITYSRSFGNSKLKGSRERSTGAEEEKARIN